jgi:hypothetical protein
MMSFAEMMPGERMAVGLSEGHVAAGRKAKKFISSPACRVIAR